MRDQEFYEKREDARAAARKARDEREAKERKAEEAKVKFPPKAKE